MTLTKRTELIVAHHRPRMGAVVFSSLALLFFTVPSSYAQAPAAGGAAPGGGAPGANVPPTSVSSGAPTANPGRPLTLADVVALAVGSNSGITAARQRLQKAQELINQVNAQGKPQLSAAAVNSYTSYRAFPPTLAAPTIQNPTLPGGGTIPAIVDAGASFSTAFVGGGGGGSAPSGGSASPGLSAPQINGAPSPGIQSPGNGGGVAPGSVGGSGATGIGAAGTGASPGGAGAPSSNTAPAGAPRTNGAAPAPAPTPAPAAPAPAPAPSNGAASPGVSQGAIGRKAPSAAELVAIEPLIAEYVTQIQASPAAGSASMAEVSPSRSPASEAASLRSAESVDANGTASSPHDDSHAAVANAAEASTAASAQPHSNNYTGRVSISQYLDLYGLVGAARGAQEDVRDFYSLDIARLQNETALAAKDLFFNVLLTRAQVDTQQEQVSYAQENARVAKSRFNQGIVSNFDVLTAQTALSTAQQQLIAAEDQRDLAQTSLAYLLGTDPDQPLTLVAPALPSLDQPVDVAASTNAALANRPELRQAETNIREAQRLVKLAGSPLLPAVGLVGSAYRTSSATQTAPENYAEISAELTLPLDDAGATRSRVRSAKVDVQAQYLARDQIQQNARLEVRQASVNIRSAQALVASTQTGVTQAQEALRLARERYGAGLGTLLDVLNALAQLAATRTNLANAQFFYQVSLAQLVRAVGGR